MQPCPSPNFGSAHSYSLSPASDASFRLASIYVHMYNTYPPRQLITKSMERRKVLLLTIASLIQPTYSLRRAKTPHQHTIRTQLRILITGGVFFQASPICKHTGCPEKKNSFRLTFILRGNTCDGYLCWSWHWDNRIDTTADFLLLWMIWALRFYVIHGIAEWGSLNLQRSLLESIRKCSLQFFLDCQ